MCSLRSLLLALVVLASLLLPMRGWAARQTNGTNQSLQSASSINLTAYTQVALAFWLWWDSFADDDDLAFEFGDGTGDRVFLDPNSSGFGGGIAYVHHTGNVGNAIRSFPRWGAAGWHQFVINLDIAQTGAAEIVSVYVDATSQTLTTQADNDNTGTYPNRVLNLMSRNNTTLFAAGRIAEFGVYGGINLTQTDVTNLQTQLPNQVQAGSLVHYWKVCGVDSPETPTVDSINLTVNGATQVAHPSAVSSSCNAAGSSSSLSLIGVGR